MSLSSDARRRILKRSFLIGALSTKQSNTNNITIDESTLMGPMRYLEIVGNAKVKDIPNLAEVYKDYLTNIDNYIDSGTTSIWVIPFPSEWLGKELTFSLKEKTKMLDISFEVCDGTSIFANSTRLLDYSGNLYEVTSSAYSYFKFTGVLPDDIDKISQFWQNYDVSVKGILSDYPGLELSSDVPIKIKIQGQSSGQTAEVEIPDRIRPDESSPYIGLRFSQWDKLMISYNPKQVIYEQGSNLQTAKSSDIKSGTPIAGVQVFRHYLGECLPGEGLCSHFNVGKSILTDLAENDNMVVIGDPGDYKYYAVYRFDRAGTEEGFKAWVDLQAEIGTPVTCLGHSTSHRQYDLTNTDLGQQLLNLKLYAGYSSITVESDLPISSMTCKYYSYEDWDDYRLTVKYQDKEGNTIRNTDYHAVRAGSVYEITHKYISGYTCITPDIKGIMSTDTEVIFEYVKN